MAFGRGLRHFGRFLAKAEQEWLIAEMNRALAALRAARLS